jgi:tetratricopeptide (TPR) repeat protein
MSETLECAARRLAEARSRGDADDIAEALALHANALLQAGKIAEARDELDEAAAIHRDRGRAYDEARLTHMAATLHRMGGNLDEAQKRAEHALARGGAGTPIAVSAATEMGEIALARKDAAAAARAYAEALAHGERTGLIPAGRAALLRRRGMALAAGGRHADAVRDLQQAHALLRQSGDSRGATRALIEAATALQNAGDLAAAKRLRAEAAREAQQSADRSALADLAILESAEALERKDADKAMAAALEARSHALAARDPVPYIGAAHAISRLAEARNDRLGAYEAAAAGWATLADLLGQDAARAAFKPALEQMRQRWGPETFAKVKEEYEAGRRA